MWNKSSPPVEKMNVLLAKLTGTVEALFGLKLLLGTNVVLVVLFTALGDFCQQRQLIWRRLLQKYDWIRTRNQTVSATPIGFVYHFWYAWLDGTYPDSDFKTVMFKVVLDLLIMSPVAWTMYFALLTLVERGSWRLFVTRAFKKGGKIYLMEWLVWPPAQYLNFCYLPTRYRVLCDMVIQLCFDTYASYLLYDEPIT